MANAHSANEPRTRQSKPWKNTLRNIDQKYLDVFEMGLLNYYQQKKGGLYLLQHRLINHLGWKRPLRSSCPAVNLTRPSPPLNHVPKHHVYNGRHMIGK